MSFSSKTTAALVLVAFLSACTPQSGTINEPSNTSATPGTLSSASGAVSYTSPSTVTTNPATGVVTCLTPLQATMQVASTGTLYVNTPINFLITAQGCGGNYEVAGSAPVAFTSKTTITQTYAGAGSEQPSAVINAMSTEGTVISTVTVVAGPLSIVPYPAAACTVVQSTATPVLGQPVYFTLSTQGVVATASINQTAITTPGQPVAVLPLTAGSSSYVASGSITTVDGQSAICSASYTYPSCTMAAQSTVWTQATIEVTLAGGVASLIVDGVTENSLPVPPNNTVTVNENFTLADQSTGTSKATVTGFYGETSNCSTAYTVPPFCSSTGVFYNGTCFYFSGGAGGNPTSCDNICSSHGGVSTYQISNATDCYNVVTQAPLPSEATAYISRYITPSSASYITTTTTNIQNEYGSSIAWPFGEGCAVGCYPKGGVCSNVFMSYSTFDPTVSNAGLYCGCTE